MSPVLEVMRDNDVCSLILNRPEKMNALNAELVEALIQAIEEANASGVRLIVLSGRGKNFSAGFDQGGLERESDADLLLRLVRIETLLQLLASSPCLTLAFAQGRNFGAGVDLFATCKQRFCSAEATFRMPGLMFGLVLGTRRFAGLVGHSKAREILERTATFSGTDALALGLASGLCETEERELAIDQTRRTATLFDPKTQAHLYRVLDREQADQDMADLVSSASRPGLKARMIAYMNSKEDASLTSGRC